MALSDWTDLDATTLAALIRDGEVHPSELVDTALSAIGRVNPQLNAVVHPMAEIAKKAATSELPDGPFRGVPMVVKDLDGFVAGVPYTMSSRFLQGFIPDHDAEVIARFRRAGFIFLAKTNCPEFGILGTTEPELRGPTHNPWKLGRSTGGSSGGSAALVAARAVPVGHGGDGGGSIRIPASACGLFGLKVSRGLLPLGPDIGEGWGGFVVPGVLTRSVRDSAGIYDVLRGDDVGAPYFGPRLERPLLEEVGAPVEKLRVAICPGSLFGRTTHPDCAAALEIAAKLMRDLGHEVEEARPEFDRDALVYGYLVQIAAGVATELEDVAKWTGKVPTAAGFEPTTWFLGQLGHLLSAADLQASRDAAMAAGRSLGRFFAKYDVLLTPTMAHPPVEHGVTALKPAERFGLGVMRTMPVKPLMVKTLRDLADKSLERVPNTQIFNMTGLPAMSLPLHHAPNGMPIGVQVATGLGRDGLLIRLAAQIEAAAPWIGRKPGVCA